MNESFPCIICNANLTRVFGSEGQPNDGLMCMSYGNYGSTIFDPEDYSYLAFNICDDCMKAKAVQKLIYFTRSRRPVVYGKLHIGYQRVHDYPYLLWTSNQHTEDVYHIELEDFDFPNRLKDCELQYTKEELMEL